MLVTFGVAVSIGRGVAVGDGGNVGDDAAAVCVMRLKAAAATDVARSAADGACGRGAQAATSPMTRIIMMARSKAFTTADSRKAWRPASKFADATIKYEH